MKHKKFYRVFGIALILSLLLTVVLASPVFGVAAVTLYPATGLIGSSVTVIGTGFSAAQPVGVYFSAQAAIAGQAIGTAVTSYVTLDIATADTSGAFTSTKTIPTLISTVAVTPGTYYIYTTVLTSSTPNNIITVSTFTVTGVATISLSAASGAAGSSVTITGSNFTPNTILVFKFDTTTVPAISGQTSSLSTGAFVSGITIPSSATAGAHSISVTASTTSTDSETYTVTASGTLDPPSPASGPAGTDVTIIGFNFPVSTALVFKYETTVIAPKSGDTATRTGGNFISTVTIPSTASSGAHTITVTAGSSTVTTTFTVNPPATTTPPPTTTTPAASTSSLSSSASGDSVGSLIVIGGGGFTAGGTVTINYDGVKVTEGNINTSGYFVINFTVPVSVHGAHVITATDGINTGNVTYTVESTAPGTPIPLEPAMGASIKSPYLFDWNDVTDPSAPVIYDLQIATSSDFSANSLVVDKTGLTKSEYTLTDTEGLRLSNQVVTYYWRERASDAASNASGWTGAGQFSISKPFKFTGWPMYVSIGVGALLFFLFGLWIGRRTAFYY